jgi:hypothetical protein
MSAFQLESEHIAAMIRAGMAYNRGHLWFKQRRYNDSDTEELFDLLAQENVKSLCARYGPRDCEPVKFQRGNGIISPVELLKACSCYDYQSCEHDDYYTSKAYELVEQIRHAAISSLPGYDKAPWGINC